MKVTAIQIIKSISLFIAGSVLGVMSYYSLNVYNQHGAIVAKGVSSEGLLSIRIGMTPNEIVNLIGPPLCIKYKKRNNAESGDSSIRMNISRHNDDSEMWIYARPSKVSLGGIEINLFFKNGTLSSAYAENYDLGVYKCDIEGCPTIWNQEEFNSIDIIKKSAFHSF